MTHNDLLEAYDMLVKEEHGSDAQPSPLGLASAAAVTHWLPEDFSKVPPIKDVPPHDSHKLIVTQ